MTPTPRSKALPACLRPRPVPRDLERFLSDADLLEGPGRSGDPRQDAELARLSAEIRTAVALLARVDASR